MSSHQNPIPVVDLFAGPGGLGEGFASLNNGSAFRIAVSAEKDPVAHQTLRLRAYFRLLKRCRPEKLDDYYNYCNGSAENPFTEATFDLWKKATEEALCIEIGNREGNERLDAAVQQALQAQPDGPWVLIGGPPCQAYSLVGRARNKGNPDYQPEKDPRQFLYREYLRIIAHYQPHVFVMENVKGILSAKVNGESIFDRVLTDLSAPNLVFHTGIKPAFYRIVSLVSNSEFRHSHSAKHIDPQQFVIRCESYGIPQARHRVILLGIREDRFPSIVPHLPLKGKATVNEAIGLLPPLRSRLSKQADNNMDWSRLLKSKLCTLAYSAMKCEPPDYKLAAALGETANQVGCFTDIGGNRYPKTELPKSDIVDELSDWLNDKRLNVWLNHEARRHRMDDIVRYGYAATFAGVHGRSPKGHKEFNLPGLAPAHRNWESGAFDDRFRVQMADSPSTTVTSHISKDGHYFIHPDPRQCRSLTVREAARIQTFPDNYFFMGGRTDQYHQVGNAVPPFLAAQIAGIVLSIVDRPATAILKDDGTAAM